MSFLALGLTTWHLNLTYLHLDLIPLLTVIELGHIRIETLPNKTCTTNWEIHLRLIRLSLLPRRVKLPNYRPAASASRASLKAKLTLPALLSRLLGLQETLSLMY